LAPFHVSLEISHRRSSTSYYQV